MPPTFTTTSPWSHGSPKPPNEAPAPIVIGNYIIQT